jgi:LacI family transcriptional regulator
MSNRTKTIGLFLGSSAQDQWMRGLSRFARTREDWMPVQMGSPQIDPATFPSTAMADGIIVSLSAPPPGVVAALSAWRVPIVNLIQNSPPLAFAAVCPDNDAAGRMAAEHLLGLGLRRFGYVGTDAAADNAFRRRGFERTVQSAGASCAVAEFPTLWDWTRHDEAAAEIGKWIRSVGYPCGVLAFNDSVASPFVRVVSTAGLRVPDDVAVVGIDDDAGLCEFCNPPLSSVNLNKEVVGYEAAALLDRLMRLDNASPSPPTQTLIMPIGVIEGGSSQMLAVEDDVARVLRLMRSHVGERLSVQKMAAHIRVSERTLVTKFQHCLGRSPSEEMARLRVEWSKQLLVDTEKSIGQIAHQAGYANTAHFCTSFKRRTQTTPGNYRRSMRGSSDVRNS